MTAVAERRPRRAGARSLLSSEWLVCFALLLLTLALRAPFAGNIEEDEAFFALIGRDWTQGLLPYVDRFDVKPPGLFLLYALTAKVFGASLATIKGLEIAAVAGAAFGLWRLGRDHLSPSVGLTAAVLYPFYSLGMGGVNVPGELILNAFEVFAVLAAMRAARGEARAAALCGLLFGCAFAIKQSAAFEAGAVLSALLIEAPDRRAAGRRLIAFGLAGAVAPLGFALYFLAHGHFAALWSEAVLGAGGRLGGDNVGFSGGLARLPGGLKPALVLVAGAAMTLMRLKNFSRTAIAQPLRLCIAWLVGAAAALIAMRAMYDHYFLTLIPPLLLLAGARCSARWISAPGAVRYLRGGRCSRRRRCARWSWLASAICKAVERTARPCWPPRRRRAQRGSRPAIPDWSSTGASCSLSRPGPRHRRACSIRSTSCATSPWSKATSWPRRWRRARAGCSWRTRASAWSAKRRRGSKR